MTGPVPLPQQFLHTVRFKASSFKWEYPRLSLRASGSCLRLLPLLLVTSISPFIFPSITRCRRHFLLNMWPIQLVFRFLISCRIFLCSLTLSNWNIDKKMARLYHDSGGWTPASHHRQPGWFVEESDIRRGQVRFGQVSLWVLLLSRVSGIPLNLHTGSLISHRPSVTSVSEGVTKQHTLREKKCSTGVKPR
jgi:hypothetical protein